MAELESRDPTRGSYPNGKPEMRRPAGRDRIARSFMENGAPDAAGRTLGAYDEFNFFPRTTFNTQHAISAPLRMDFGSRRNPPPSAAPLPGTIAQHQWAGNGQGARFRRYPCKIGRFDSDG